MVAEFDNYLHDELDLVREAANAAQLRRNMAPLDLVLIPEIFWDFCHPEVMVMQRMNGAHQPDRPPARGRCDIPAGARRRDHLLHPGVPRRFFHADMHPATSR